MLRLRSLSSLALAAVVALTGAPAVASTATAASTTSASGTATRAASDAGAARTAASAHHRRRHHHHRHGRKHHRRHHRHHAARVRDTSPVTDVAVPFEVASFNALGASHTDGRRPERPGWAGSRARIRRAGALFEARGLDVIGVQEFQPRQQKAFREAYGDTYDFMIGDGSGRPNGVVWRRSRFTLLSTSMVTVPYFWGQPTPMPLVTLQDRRTGRKLTFLSVHNPADTHGRAQKWRNAATAHELRTLSALRAEHPGTPVFWLGDMNDRATFYCAATLGGVFHAAAGGSNDLQGCLMPEYDGIDWVLATHAIGFSGWTVDRTTQDQGISDHPLVFSTAVIGAAPGVPAPPTEPTGYPGGDPED